MTEALLAIGTNVGDRQATLLSAVASLNAHPGCRVRAVSRFIETAPVGGPPQETFLNGALVLETELAPRALLALVQAVETAHGRLRQVHWGPRTLDIDIIAYGSLVVDLPELKVPHPHLAERLFVLEPLVEVAPDWVHPGWGQTVRQLYEALSQSVRRPSDGSAAPAVAWSGELGGDLVELQGRQVGWGVPIPTLVRLLDGAPVRLDQGERAYLLARLLLLTAPGGPVEGAVVRVVVRRAASAASVELPASLVASRVEALPWGRRERIVSVQGFDLVRLTLPPDRSPPQELQLWVEVGGAPAGRVALGWWPTLVEGGGSEPERGE